VDNATDPDEFLQNRAVIAAVNAAFKKAENNMLTKDGHMLIISYIAAAIVFSNAQRPGVIRNMTIQEFHQRLNLNSKILIQVINHKTASSMGPANIVITPGQEQMMMQYLQTIRWKVIPQKDEFANLFFLTNTGNEFRKISETIQNIGQDFDIIIPSAGLHRKVIATEAHASVDDSTMRKLNTHMTHSTATSSLYYQFPSQREAVKVYGTIQDLRKRRYFTSEEDQWILKEYPVQNDSTPTLEMCQLLVNKYSMDRSAKNVQDRWRTLKKLSS